MQLVKHWVRVRDQLTTPAGRRAVSGVGWSNESVEAARAMAEQRLQNHRARLLENPTGPRAPGGYPYSDGRPLQEEIVEKLQSDDGSMEALITRNAYGALVLNCAQVLFVDLDYANFTAQPSLWNRLFGKAPSNEDTALAHAERVAARTPEWGFRVYRTKAGLRLVLTNVAADARDPFWIELLRSFGSDPMYVQLCEPALVPCPAHAQTLALQPGSAHAALPLCHAG